MRLRGFRLGVAGVGLATVALLLAACTGGSHPNPPKPVDDDINPVAYGKVHTGGTLRLPIDAPIGNFNRYAPDGANADTASIASATLPSLFTIGPDNVFSPDPDYLTGEPAVVTSPAQTITYKLNPKAVWSDGTPLSYRDFAAQWSALRGTDPAYAISAPADYSDIASVTRGVSDQQVIVTMKPGTIDADWRGLFSPLYPASATQSAVAFDASWRAKPLLSAGPFMYASTSTPSSARPPAPPASSSAPSSAGPSGLPGSSRLPGSSGVPGPSGLPGRSGSAGGSGSAGPSGPANNADTGTAGTGAAGTPTTATYTLVRNPRWWGRPAKLDSIVFTVEPTPAAGVAALSSGAIDALDVGTDAPTYAQVAKLPRIAVRHANGPDTRDITLNGSRAPLNDIALRQAIAMGIDRNAIARAQLAPLGIASPAVPGSHIFAAGQTGYHDNAGTLGSYAPAAAAQALSADGWVDDPTTHSRTKEGKTLTIQFVIPESSPTSLTDAQLVQQQLAKLDVGVDIKQVPADSFFSGYIAPGSFDMTVFSWLGGNFPITDAAVVYQPEGPGGDWARNYSRVSVPQLSTLFRQAESDLDQASADAAANQADVLIWQNVMSIPLYQSPDVRAVDAKVANFGAFGYATPDWTSVGFTK